jgi:hypothetical protein
LNLYIYIYGTVFTYKKKIYGTVLKNSNLLLETS